MSTVRLGIQRGMKCQVEGCDSEANDFPYCHECRDELEGTPTTVGEALHVMAEEVREATAPLMSADWALMTLVISPLLYVLAAVVKILWASYFGGN